MTLLVWELFEKEEESESIEEQDREEEQEELEEKGGGVNGTEDLGISWLYEGYWYI